MQTGLGEGPCTDSAPHSIPPSLLSALPFLTALLPAPHCVCSPPLNVSSAVCDRDPASTRESFSLPGHCEYVPGTQFTHGGVQHILLMPVPGVSSAFSTGPGPALLPLPPAIKAAMKPPHSLLTLKASLVLSVKKGPAFDNLPPHPAPPSHAAQPPPGSGGLISSACCRHTCFLSYSLRSGLWSLSLLSVLKPLMIIRTFL